MHKPTVKSILLNWLKSRIDAGNFLVASHEIEQDLRDYGLLFYDTMFNAGTAGRQWREFKRNPELMKAIDVKEVKQIQTKSTEHTRELITI